MKAWILSRLFVWYVVGNMLICSLLFFPWARPRETISGLIGRWSYEDGRRGRFARIAARVIDFMYFWEPDHCRITAAQEAEARKALGYS